MKKVEILLKGFSLTALLLLGATAVEAQEIETTVSADVVNQYIWRGQELGNTGFQPTLGIEYKGLSLTAWGNVGLTEPADTKEFDLTLGYTIGGFNIGICDYWFSAGNDPKGRYFMYEAHRTNHIFEGNIGYDFGPVALQWFTNFSGNDYKVSNGKRAYSSYFEISAPFKLATCDWTATAGAVPFGSEAVYGTEDFAVTNLSLRATKDIKITDSFSIPIFGEVIGNPCSQKAYLVFGFTLCP